MHALRALFLALAAALATATVLRLPGAWASGNALNHVSGAWMTLADDLARGTFYRPLADPVLGYGGTRFFPLAFALHGAVRATGADLVASGFALSLAAGLTLALALWLLVRRAGARRGDAAALAALAFAAFATQHALASVRGDLLAVALSALGLWAVAGPGPSRRAVIAAALLFALAFAAKPTALTAPAAAAAWLALRGERRAAAALALAVVASAGAVVLGTNVLSEGRFLAILADTATGGAGGGDLVRGPVRLAEHLVIADPAALLLAGAAGLAAVTSARARLRAARGGASDPALLASLWLAAAAGGALVVFASPGTGVNHLVELEAAAAAVLGTAWVGPRPGSARGSADDGARRATRFARLLAPAVALAGVAVALGMAREDGRTARLREARLAAAALPVGGRILSEDPLVLLVGGRRPEVLDPWMLRLALESEPALAPALVERLRGGEYDAVVLFQDVDAPGAERWYARGNLGATVVDAVREGYRLSEQRGRYRIYVPVVPRAGPGPLASVPRG
jgi:hypothetical protein